MGRVEGFLQGLNRGIGPLLQTLHIAQARKDREDEIKRQEKLRKDEIKRQREDEIRGEARRYGIPLYHMTTPEAMITPTFQGDEGLEPRPLDEVEVDLFKAIRKEREQVEADRELQRRSALSIIEARSRPAPTSKDIAEAAGEREREIQKARKEVNPPPTRGDRRQALYDAAMAREQARRDLEDAIPVEETNEGSRLTAANKRLTKEVGRVRETLNANALASFPEKDREPLLRSLMEVAFPITERLKSLESKTGNARKIAEEKLFQDAKEGFDIRINRYLDEKGISDGLERERVKASGRKIMNDLINGLL